MLCEQDLHTGRLLTPRDIDQALLATPFRPFLHKWKIGTLAAGTLGDVAHDVLKRQVRCQAVLPTMVPCSTAHVFLGRSFWGVC